MARAGAQTSDVPEPRYLQTSDGTYIAYEVIGSGPVDVAWQLDYVGNLDCVWDSPLYASWLEALASMGRVILHDTRATGLSSRDTEPPNLETRAADLRAVLDHVGSDSAVIGGFFESIAPGVLLAATDPDRVRGLVWWDPQPRTTWAPSYPWGLRPAEVEVSLRRLRDWGTLEYGQAWAAEFESDGLRPTDVDIRWMAKSSRNTCTPDVAIAMNEMWWETDLTEVLPSVRVPTLLLVESPDETYLAKAEYVAALMPAAELVVIPGEQWPTAAIMQAYIRPPLEAVGRFLGLAPTRPELDSVLASVLFTDIVGSTRQQAALGDHAWKEVLQRHNALVRGLLAQWRGVERDTAGDGFYATFDGPARAVRCALGIVAGAAELGLEVRAGVHTGECEVIDGKLAGIAVATGARIAALAAPSQVLVSQTVKDLVAGSRLGLDDVGERQLRGVPGNWRLYAAAG